MVVQSDAWWNADLKVIELTKVFRQDDADFIERLNRMRKGHTTHDDVRWMNHHFYHRYEQQQRQQQQAPPIPTPPLGSPSPAVAISPLSVASPFSGVEAQEPYPDRDPLHLFPKNNLVSWALRFGRSCMLAGRLCPSSDQLTT